MYFYHYLTQWSDVKHKLIKKSSVIFFPVSCDKSMIYTVQKSANW